MIDNYKKKRLAFWLTFPLVVATICAAYFSIVNTPAILGPMSFSETVSTASTASTSKESQKPSATSSGGNAAVSTTHSAEPSKSSQISSISIPKGTVSRTSQAPFISVPQRTISEILQSLYPNSSSGSSETYESVYNEYSTKMTAAVPGLIEQYNQEAAANKDGSEGFKKIFDDKINSLAAICNEGAGKMAMIYQAGSAAYSGLQSWADKLVNAYYSEAGKIIEVYLNSMQ